MQTCLNKPESLWLLLLLPSDWSHLVYCVMPMVIYSQSHQNSVSIYLLGCTNIAVSIEHQASSINMNTPHNFYQSEATALVAYILATSVAINGPVKVCNNCDNTSGVQSRRHFVALKYGHIWDFPFSLNTSNFRVLPCNSL